jgi:MFS family permease
MGREKVSSAAGLAQAVAIIVTLTFSVRASNNVLQTTVPLLAKFDLTYTQLEVGLLMATMSASALVAALVNSRVSVTARRRLFILFSALYAVSLFTFTFSNRVSVLAYVSLAGVSYGFIFPNIMTAAQLFPDQRLRERVIAAYTLALAISLIAGPALESLVLAYFPLRLSFLFFAPLGIIVAALSPLVRFPREPGKRREDGGKGPSVWSRVGFRVGIYTFLVYNAPTAVLLTFGGIFAREAFHAPYWLVTLIFAAFFTASFLTRVLLLARPIGRLILT